MSRSGYTDDCIDDVLAYGRWRGAVKSSTYGKRGQAMLRELLEALDALPEKKLIPNSFKDEGEDGGFCTLGALAWHRGEEIMVDPESLDYDREAHDQLSRQLRAAWPLLAEIMFENDEGYCGVETDERRWQRMRNCIASKIVS